MSHQDLPDGFLPLSDAINRLAHGIWGGLRRPVPVVKLKKAAKKASIGFGRWRSYAAQCLRAAALNGELRVFVVAKPQSAEDRRLKRPPPPTLEPVMVPTSVLAQLMVPRGVLPDHAIRPTLKTVADDQELFVLLNLGLLVVHESEFKVWYREERARGKWPSQRLKSMRGRGRPTKQTEGLRNAIVAHVHDGSWSGKDKLTKLHRMLLGSGRSDIPSADTLGRLVDCLHAETGEPGLLKKPQGRAKNCCKISLTATSLKLIQAYLLSS